MSMEILKDLGQIAGVGGIALGVFLILFRDLIRKKIFPRLTRNQSWRILLVFMILVWSVALCGIAAWVMIQKGAGPSTDAAGPAVLTASLWRVDLDTKGAMIASTEIRQDKAGDVTVESLDRIVDWAAGVLEVSRPREQASVQVTVDVPSDLSAAGPRIERSPPGPMNVLFWDTSNGKMRLPLNAEAIRHINIPFHLEIIVPGYAPQVVAVTPGERVQETFSLSPARVSIGIEDFSGSGPSSGIADRLAERLARHGGFAVVNPEMLATIREEIARHNKMLAENPMMQLPLRELGVEYILSGSVQ